MKFKVALFVILFAVFLYGVQPLYAAADILAAEVVTENQSTVAENTRIHINIPSRELTLYHQGRIVYEFPVAVGQSIYPTPVGNRSMTQIVWNPWWIPPKSGWAKNDVATPPGPLNPLGPVKMDLGKAILLHGTSRESSVGTAASHGCMRMYNRDARTLAWWIQSNFTDKADPNLITEYDTHRGTSFHVNLTQNIPIEITYNLFEISGGFFRLHPDIYKKLGNVKEQALSWLEGEGYSPDKVDEIVLEDMVALAKTQSVQVTMKELIPKKLKQSKRVKKRPVKISQVNQEQPLSSSIQIVSRM